MALNLKPYSFRSFLDPLKSPEGDPFKGALKKLLRNPLKGRWTYLHIRPRGS